MIVVLFSCESPSHQESNGLRKDPRSPWSHCQLIEKHFVNKAAKMQEWTELYLRCSMDDYFIKFCESNVSAKELRPYVGEGIAVKMEIRQGLWDHCNENPAYAQSRGGPYAILLEWKKR